MEQDEENTHSRFLGDLLNPRGAHGQGNLFLREFLDHCHHKLDRVPLPSSTYSAERFVETERGIPGGRIDIVLSCPQLGQLIAIENKIFAPEQPQQMARYYRWIESLRYKPDQQILIFLTPDGRLPVSADGCKCLSLSYCDDISAILNKARTAIEAENLYTIIRQYLDVITNLVPDYEATDEAE